MLRHRVKSLDRSHAKELQQQSLCDPKLSIILYPTAIQPHVISCATAHAENKFITNATKPTHVLNATFGLISSFIVVHPLHRISSCRHRFLLLKSLFFNFYSFICLTLSLLMMIGQFHSVKRRCKALGLVT